MQVRRRRQRRRVLPILMVGFLSLLLVITYFAWRPEPPARTTTAVAAVDRPVLASAPKPPEPARSRAVADLQSRLSGISAAHPGTRGIVVLDPYSGKSASLNADRRFVAASLSKLYALLTLYKAAARGEVDLEDKITMRPSDVWAEGTGVLYTYPVGHTMTLRECAEYLVKESDNTAEVMLNRYLGEKNIEAELRSLGADSTSYWLPNTTTPDDMLLVIEAIADPSFTSPGLSNEMLDIMTDTSFEGRLPRPLPEDARVAHKIGSYESTFSDAGIVFPGGDGREYYIVVFSEGATQGEARQAISDISLAAYRALSEADAR